MQEVVELWKERWIMEDQSFRSVPNFSQRLRAIIGRPYGRSSQNNQKYYWAKILLGQTSPRIFDSFTIQHAAGCLSSQPNNFLVTGEGNCVPDIMGGVMHIAGICKTNTNQHKSAKEATKGRSGQSLRQRN